MRPSQAARCLAMKDSLLDLIDRYDPGRPLAEASTCPASWYIDPRILELELETTFANTWQYACRLDQVREPGQFVTLELAGEPLLIVRGSDHVLRGFFNVCRHHAAAVMTEREGCAKRLQCPYHGWTYTLEGALKAAPAFEGVRNFDPADHGLMPVATTAWERHRRPGRLEPGPGSGERVRPRPPREAADRPASPLPAR